MRKHTNVYQECQMINYKIIAESFPYLKKDMPGTFRRQRSLAGYSLWGHRKLDTTEWLSTAHIVDLHCCVISLVQQDDSVTYTHTHILFHILFHYGLSQDIEYSFQCYAVGPCCLSTLFILFIIACICSSQSLPPFLPHCA